MKIDVTQTIVDLDGKQIGEDGTLRKVCLEALLSVMPEDQGSSGEEKAKLFSIAVAIHDSDAPDLTLEEWAKVRARIGKGYGALIVGRAFALLDGPKPKAAESA